VVASAQETGWGEVGQSLFDDMLARFILPEHQRRVAESAWPEGEPIVRFQVIFPEDRPPETRLNDEVHGMVRAIAARDIEAGQDVMIDDLAGLVGYEPLPEEADISHVTAFMHRDGWGVTFSFAQGHPSRHGWLKLGREFVATSQNALAGGQLGPFFENAFAASETLAKAELLSSRPTVELVLNSKRHAAVSTNYHLWARLGNTEARFAKLLSRLSDLRGSARYLDGRNLLTQAEAKEGLETLEAMEQHVADIVDGVTRDENTPVMTVYATRPIRAGELVGAGDYSLRPPKPG
jgi:hypothetical protein